MNALRAYQPSDDEAIAALYQRVHALDGSVDAWTLEQWRAFCAISYVDGARDFHIALSGDAIVGLLTSFARDDARRVRITVDPAHRRRGVGHALLRVAEAQARAGGNRVLESFVTAKSVAGCAFAKARGFDVHVHDLFLRRDASPFPAPSPEGVRVRPYEPGRDDEQWVTLANATLARDKGFHPETLASLRSYTRARGFALWLAEVAEPIGFCHVEAREKDGYVHALGVLSESEGRGIGAALLARGIDTLRTAGVDSIELCTERDNARARRLYARAGFNLDREAFTLRRTV
jgi:mycothiol synthase